MNIFNKICDAFIVYAFKDVFQEAAVKQAYVGCAKIARVYINTNTCCTVNTMPQDVHVKTSMVFPDSKEASVRRYNVVYEFLGRNFASGIRGLKSETL